MRPEFARYYAMRAISQSLSLYHRHKKRCGGFAKGFNNRDAHRFEEMHDSLRQERWELQRRETYRPVGIERDKIRLCCKNLITHRIKFKRFNVLIGKEVRADTIDRETDVTVMHTWHRKVYQPIYKDAGLTTKNVILSAEKVRTNSKDVDVYEVKYINGKFRTEIRSGYVVKTRLGNNTTTMRDDLAAAIKSSRRKLTREIAATIKGERK